MINELERMRKEWSWPILGCYSDICVDGHDSRSAGLDLNPGPSEHEVVVIAIRLRCSDSWAVLTSHEGGLPSDTIQYSFGSLSLHSFIMQRSQSYFADALRSYDFMTDGKYLDLKQQK
jgi:hypothetical protein